MSKDNWKGTSGWGTIDDPTGVLSGRVLVATGGDTSTEDYALTEIGTSNAFTLVHYSVFMNYAWNLAAGTQPMNGGHFSVIARATTFTGAPALAYNCYLGQVDVANMKAKIIRRNNNVELTLAEVDLSDKFISRGVLHSLELRCYDTDPVTLQLLIDNNEVLTAGDTSADKKLTSGVSGIESLSGTVYVDNFTIYQYTSTGVAPAEWTPAQLTSPKVWLKADAGVTTVGTEVTGWADQSGNANNASALTAVAPDLVTAGTNGLDVITFDGASHEMTIADVASIDLNATSGSIFIVCNTDTTPGTATSNRAVSKGASYGMGIGSDAVSTKQVFATINGGSQDSDNDSITNGVYQILGVVYDSGAVADATRYGFWVDGTNKGVSALVMGVDNATDMKIGSNNTAGYFDGTLCEILVFNEELSIADRQLVEGYLAHKWATWPRLPTSHPYYRVAPTV